MASRDVGTRLPGSHKSQQEAQHYETLFMDAAFDVARDGKLLTYSKGAVNFFKNFQKNLHEHF